MEHKLGRYTIIEWVVRQGCVVSTYFFNLYSDAILSKPETLPGFIKGGRDLNSIRYADFTVLVADTERKLRNLLERVVEKGAKKD